MNPIVLRALACAAVATLVASCGGGTSLAGIDRLGATAPISGFGSVIQSGVEWQTGSATITIDGQPAAESDLHVGQLVTISGTREPNGTAGTAETIDLHSNVLGVVTAVDVANGRFTVLSQTVIVDADTSVDPALGSAPGIGAITVDTRVRVTGYVDASGVIHATRVDLDTGNGDVRVRGEVGSVDTGLHTLTINGLTVDYSAIAPTGFPGGQPAPGDLVQASGTANPEGTMLDAHELEYESGTAPAPEGDLGHVEGLVTGVSGANFAVGTVTVITDGATVFGNGQSLADVVVGARVEVEGDVDASGRIVARKVEVRGTSAQDSVEIVGDVTATATGGFTMLDGPGVAVDVDASTRYEDQREPNPDRTFSLAAIVVGDHLRVRGGIATGGHVLATRVEREDASSTIVLRGPLSSAASPTLTLLGVTLNTGVGTLYYDGSTPVSANTFFATVTAGTVVVARTGGSVSQPLTSVAIVPIGHEGGSDD